MKRLLSLAVLAFVISSPAFGLSVIATIPDLKAIAAEVAGPDASVESFAKGTQDPHYLEAKPSYMVKASQADLILAIGLGLEVGWLPSILQGARNPIIQPGQPGYLEVGPGVEPLEVAKGAVSRADGDVHPEGNPHVTLDPERAGKIAGLIATKMGALDPPHAAAYTKRAEALQKRLAEKTKAWQARITKSGVKKVITFHKTLTYFLNRFGLENPAILEPLPGVPPTAKHTLDVIALAKTQKVPLILVENYFDPTVAERVAQDVEGIRALTVPVAVDGDEGVASLDALYERLVQAVEGKVKNG